MRYYSYKRAGRILRRGRYKSRRYRRASITARRFGWI